VSFIARLSRLSALLAFTRKRGTPKHTHRLIFGAAFL
jgi:hypothetical protein